MSPKTPGCYPTPTQSYSRDPNRPDCRSALTQDPNQETLWMTFGSYLLTLLTFIHTLSPKQTQIHTLGRKPDKIKWMNYDVEWQPKFAQCSHTGHEHTVGSPSGRRICINSGLEAGHFMLSSRKYKQNGLNQTLTCVWGLNVNWIVPKYNWLGVFQFVLLTIVRAFILSISRFRFLTH